jgi:hypothetical protein
MELEEELEGFTIGRVSFPTLAQLSGTKNISP